MCVSRMLNRILLLGGSRMIFIRRFICRLSILLFCLASPLVWASDGRLVNSHVNDSHDNDNFSLSILSSEEKPDLSGKSDKRPFDKKIASYFKIIAEDIKEKKNNPVISPLVYALDDFDTCQKNAKRARYLSTISLLPKYEFQDDNDGDLCERLRSALLIKVSVAMSDYSMNALGKMLVNLDKHIAYWQAQSQHQWKYFLRKSPSKWFAGKSQQKEIEDNISHLKNLKRRYLVQLKELNDVRNLFNVHGCVDSHYAWLSAMTLTGQKLIDNYASKDMHNAPAMFDILVHDMRNVFENLPGYKKRLAHQIGKSAQLPHYFIRNWLVYSTALAGLAGTAWYINHNPNLIPDYVKQMKGAGQMYYQLLILYPLNTFLQTLGWQKGSQGSVGWIRKICDYSFQTSTSRLEKQISLLFALSLTIPTYLGAKGVVKLWQGAKKLFRYDAEPLKLLVEEIQDAISKCKNYPNDKHEGTLVYKVYQLKHTLEDLKKLRLTPLSSTRLNRIASKIASLTAPISYDDKLEAAKSIAKNIKKLNV